MADLSTTYMGLNLKNPIIAGSSQMTSTPGKIKKIADAGAAAVVLKSLFEEQIKMEVDAQRVNNMYGSFND
ncbi:MAG: diguanylate cyclase, partial [Bacteroidota bacterium]